MLYKLGAFSGGLTCSSRTAILCYEYNLFIIQRTKIRATQKLPVGKVKIEVETVYAVPKPGGPLEHHYEGQWRSGCRRQGAGQRALVFTANDCLDIGIALGSPVSLDYYEKAPFKFNGTIERMHVKYTVDSYRDSAVSPPKRQRAHDVFADCHHLVCGSG